MFLKALSLLAFPWVLLLLIGGCVSKREWEFELISASSNSSDESKLNISLWAHQISRSTVRLSGVIDWKFDADESTMIEALCYSSYSGNEHDFKLVPYKIENMKFFDFLNTHYKTIVYENVASCSNFPEFKDQFTPPFPQNYYVLNACALTGDGVPEILPSGFYKLIFTVRGEVEANLVIILKLGRNIIGI